MIADTLRAQQAQFGPTARIHASRLQMRTTSQWKNQHFLIFWRLLHPASKWSVPKDQISQCMTKRGMLPDEHFTICEWVASHFSEKRATLESALSFSNLSLFRTMEQVNISPALSLCFHQRAPPEMRSKKHIVRVILLRSTSDPIKPKEVRHLFTTPRCAQPQWRHSSLSHTEKEHSSSKQTSKPA